MGDHHSRCAIMQLLIDGDEATAGGTGRDLMPEGAIEHSEMDRRLTPSLCEFNGLSTCWPQHLPNLCHHRPGNRSRIFTNALCLTIVSRVIPPNSITSLPSTLSLITMTASPSRCVEAQPAHPDLTAPRPDTPPSSDLPRSGLPCQCLRIVACPSL